jgi:hypothetical protein
MRYLGRGAGVLGCLPSLRPVDRGLDGSIDHVRGVDRWFPETSSEAVWCLGSFWFWPEEL